MLPTSPPTAFDVFVPADDFRLGNRTPGRRLLRESSRLELACQRDQVTARRLGARHQLVDGGQHRRRSGRPDRLDRGGVGGGAARNPASIACACARSMAAIARVGIDVDHFAFGPQAIESGGFTGLLSSAENAGQLVQAVTASRQFPFAFLRRPEIGKGQAQVGADAADPILGAGRARRDASGGRADVQPAAPRDGQRLRDHDHVLRDTGHRLAVEGDARIWPPPCRQRVGTRDVDCRARRRRAGTFSARLRHDLRLRECHCLRARTRRA